MPPPARTWGRGDGRSATPRPEAAAAAEEPSEYSAEEEEEEEVVEEDVEVEATSPRDGAKSAPAGGDKDRPPEPKASPAKTPPAKAPPVARPPRAAAKVAETPAVAKEEPAELPKESHRSRRTKKVEEAKQAKKQAKKEAKDDGPTERHSEKKEKPNIPPPGMKFRWDGLYGGEHTSHRDDRDRRDGRDRRGTSHRGHEDRDRRGREATRRRSDRSPSRDRRPPKEPRRESSHGSRLDLRPRPYHPYAAEEDPPDPTAGGSAGQPAMPSHGPPNLEGIVGPGQFVWISPGNYWLFVPHEPPLGTPPSSPHGTSRRAPEPARPPEGRRRPPEPARPPREPRDGPRPRHKGDGKGKPPKGKGKKGKGKTGKGGTRRNRPGQAQRRRRQEAREAAAARELRAKARPAPGPPPDAVPESGPPERDLTDPPRPREHRNDADDDDDEPNDEEDGDGEEHAESETLTYDPTVELTPSELMDDRLPGKSQPAASSSPQRPTKKEPVVHWSPLASRRPGSSRPSVDPPSVPGRSQATGETAWDPQKGPAPGIRWKSGAPPAPPRYTADAKEVGSFDRFVRRVRLWAKRAASWMTDWRRRAPSGRKPERRCRARAGVHTTGGYRKRWRWVHPPDSRKELKWAHRLPQAPLPA